MSNTEATTVSATVAQDGEFKGKDLQGMRKNGKILFVDCKNHSNKCAGKPWHEPKKAFRLKAGNSGWEKRQVERAAMDALKAKEKEMIAEKEAIRQVGDTKRSTPFK